MVEALQTRSVDPRLLQWLAVQTLHDRDARLVDGGGDADDRIELARLFVDLPVAYAPEGRRSQHEPTTGMAALLGALSREGSGPQVLLVGGPGSGKSTLSTMLAQALRLPWLEANDGELPSPLRKTWLSARTELDALVARNSWTLPGHAFPVRVNLPSLARWMASHRDGGATALWQHLAARVSDELDAHGLSWEATPALLQQAVHDAGPAVWILDGLDEVPRTAGRAEVIEAVRAVVCERSARIAGIVVTTRPQGYEGEFDELDAMSLLPLPAKLALAYGELLIGAWSRRGGAVDLPERLDTLRGEFAKPEVASLLHTPLHTTIAAVLVAGRGTLPKSRYQLFGDYFHTVLRRELRKQIDHGVRDEDEGVIRTLHAHVGLLLHARAQAQQGARASLRRRELHEVLAAIYEALGYVGDERRARVERLLRFAAERLVLLIHDVEGEYSFGVRSLQEFFAAEALADGDSADVAKRLDSVVRSAHWSNVVAFVVSRYALATSPSERATALRLTVDRCVALNRGEAGPAAARCLLGSHLALAMLREVQGYASPWLHNKLWEVAFEAATTPAQEASARTVELERRRRQVGRETWWDTVEFHVRLGMIAARQLGESGERWCQQVREAAATLLEREGDAALVGWRLLHGLLLSSDSEAERLAHLHAPSGEEEGWAAFNAGMYDGNYAIPSWWCDYVNAHPDWFTPSRLLWRFRWPNVQRPVVALDVLMALGVNPPTFSLSVPIGEETIQLHWISVQHVPTLPAQMPGGTPAWCIWKRVAAFHEAPSQESLANVVESMADGNALLELDACSEKLAWPLTACVAFIKASGNAADLALQLREGSLGDYLAWCAAEARWQLADVVSQSDLTTALTAAQPWSRDIATYGIPHPMSLHDYEDLPTAATGWIAAHPDRIAMTSRMLVARSSWSIASPEHLRFLDDLLLQVDEHVYPPMLSLEIDLDGGEVDLWFAALDANGRRGHGAYLYFSGPANNALLSVLLQHLREHPAKWGLLDAMANLRHFLSLLPLDERALPALPAEAPPRAVAQHALLTLCSERFDAAERPSLLARLVWNDGASHDLRAELASTLQSRTDASAPAVDLLLAALDAPPPPAPEARDALLGALFAHARRLVQPALATPDAWEEHHLPKPFLAGQAPLRSPPVLLSIDALRNVRLFAETPAVDVPFSRPQGGRGQWIVLVGQNGVGKTTLLRALALALAAPAVTSKLLDERLRLVRNGEEARVAVTLDTGRREVVIRRGERTEQIEPVTPLPGEPPWVVAYGVRRGNALGETDRAPELGAVGELHTLFERPAALYPATQWLRDLDGDVLREQRRTPRAEGAPPGPRESVWRAVVHALQALLGVTAVEVEEGGAVYVTHPEFGRVLFEAMSDGYLSTAGWLIDMVARWIERQRELDEPVGPNVLRQMCGLVLLDEIDLHLHPVWQLRIIDDVRRLFPRMSFIVTTHNPLALQGARAGEIYVVRREGAKVELTQRDIRPGQDVDRVLFEQFGVEHTLDRETRELLAAHRQMVERGVSPDDPERKRVERGIVERFGDVGATLRDERGAADLSPLRPDEQGLVDEFLKPS